MDCYNDPEPAVAALYLREKRVLLLHAVQFLRAPPPFAPVHPAADKPVPTEDFGQVLHGEQDKEEIRKVQEYLPLQQGEQILRHKNPDSGTYRVNARERRSQTIDFDDLPNGVKRSERLKAKQERLRRIPHSDKRLPHPVA